jgi:hypothetical protein
LSATPWNLLNPVTWTVTGEGPSEPIYLLMRRWAANLGSARGPGQSPVNICQDTAVWRGKACLCRYCR